MKFWSASAKYRVTVPGQEDHFEYKGPGGAHREKVTGLHAQFEDHGFDSEAAQKRLKWSDETREVVEQALLNHSTLGTKYLRVLVEGELDGIDQTAIDAIATCLFRVTIDGEVEDCGRPALVGSDHCAKHSALTDDAPQSKPNRVAASA